MINGNRIFLDTLNKCILILFILFFPLNATHSKTIIKDAEIEKLLSEYTADLHKIGLGVTSQNIFIVSDQSINAFVTAQGNIYINTGLIYHADRPNEVKSIIAHEIGHILNNHHITRMIEYENFQKKQNIAQIIGIGTGITGLLTDSDALPDIGTGISIGGSDIARRDYLQHSRVQEFEADMSAISIMESIGESSNGLLQILEKIKKSQQIYGGNINPLELTHELPQDRIDFLKNKISKQESYEVQDSEELIHRHNLARAKIIGYQDLPSKFADNTPYANYSKAISYYQKGKYEQSKSIMTSLIKQFEYAYFYEFLAQIYFEINELELAIENLKKGQSLLDKPELEFSILHAKILTKIGGDENIRESISLLDAHKDQTIRNVRVYWQLSKSYYKLNNIPMADLSVAQYYSILGNTDIARNFAERAKNGLTPYSSGWLLADDIQNIN
tara:strand:+ start:458 stop:1795 length:1338 start_codon:yes stop_codon:yes gene_type:complete